MVGAPTGGDRVAYLPSIDRPTVTWPNGAAVALWIAPNVEHYEYLPPHNPARNPWTRSPHPDVQGYAYRDYGNRVGFWRMIDALDEAGVTCTASTNLAVFEHYPEVAHAMVSRGWEIMSHGIYNTRYLTGMSAEAEREFYAECVDTLRRHTGAQLAGMLGPAVSNTLATPDLMAEAGLIYHADWMHDDQPVPIAVAGDNPLVSVPYSMELNDVPVFSQHFEMDEFAQMASAQMTRLLADAEADGSGRVMCVALHPYLVGMPHRIDGLRSMLADLMGRDGVWQTTAAQIAAHFIAQHYDSFVSHAAQLDAAAREQVRVRASSPTGTSVAEPAEGATAPPASPGASPIFGPSSPGFGPAAHTYGMDHPHYAWSPLPARARLTWPNDATLALGAVVILEHYEWEPPPGAYQLRRRSGGLLGLPPPDYAKLTHREYGHRVGVFRVLDALEAHGITPTVAIDALTVERYPWLAEHLVERGCELVARGVAASRLLTSKLDEETERVAIAASRDAIAALTGEPPAGWFAPEAVESYRTPQLVAEAGFKYLLDWPNDEQPYAMTTPQGELWSLPAYLEADDEFALWHRRATLTNWESSIIAAAAQMRADAATEAGARALVLTLRPWLVGQPFRIGAVERALAAVVNAGPTFRGTASQLITAAKLARQTSARGRRRG